MTQEKLLPVRELCLQSEGSHLETLFHTGEIMNDILTAILF